MYEQRPPAELFTPGDDNEALARAIIVHATHMRIVLARRSGDIGQLVCVRPRLKRLDDCLFVRKVHDVETFLPGQRA
ncbi:MAG TPA: hypothetical protein VGF67_14405 [Ktedonobacteraceae bacterium]|jgi:hypothetical protein